MSYTVVGMFPTTEAAENAAARLSSAGFGKEDYTVSGYSRTGEYSDTADFEEDEKTTGFWDWLFGDNDDDRKKYSYAGSRSNIVTVYSDTTEHAERARDIMNEEGALDVNDINSDRNSGEEFVSPDNNMTTDERARIIAKAKNNLYFTNENRSYRYPGNGMSSDMDSMGREDAF